MIECCENALKCLSEFDGDIGKREMLLLLLMADAFERQGDMMRAREYDEKSKEIWMDQSGYAQGSAVHLSSSRREAIELLKAGKALEGRKAWR